MSSFLKISNFCHHERLSANAIYMLVKCVVVHVLFEAVIRFKLLDFVTLFMVT